MCRPAIPVAILLFFASAAATTAAELSASSRHFTGKTSYYGESGLLASGGKFDPTKLTAAHRTLPFGTIVRVTDPSTGRSVIVTINDRGPFKKERVLDLSLAAAKVLGMIDRGIIFVTAEVM
ncbi:MAG: septal ring lytic transglycosylase RlpA family protein [Xanthobacteraceae bacterium]